MKRSKVYIVFYKYPFNLTSCPTLHGVFDSKEKAEEYILEELEMIERNVDLCGTKLNDYIEAFKVVEMMVL